MNDKTLIETQEFQNIELKAQFLVITDLKKP